MELEREETIVEEEVEGEGGGLEARQRRRKTDNYGAQPQTAESSGEEAEESCLSDDGADQAQSLLAVRTSGVEPKKNDQNVIQEELANGKSTSDIVDDHKGITTEGENQMLKNANVENGSKPQDYPNIQTNIMTKSEEITPLEQITVQKKSALEAVEFDLERILDEQDTHDLYCPNCSSCITKRVILLKRKRTVKEIQHDVPSKKPHEEQSVLEKSLTEAPLDHLTNRDDAQEPDIYRCLSCFSFFIPIVGGFNIFRIFEKGKESRLQSSKKASEEKVDSTSSVKVDESKRKGTESGISSPDESSTISSQVDQLAQKETAPSPSIPGALNFGEGQIISQKNDGLLITRGRKGIFNQEITAGGEEMDDHSQVNKPNLGIPIQAGELDDNGVATEEIDADIPVSGFPTVGFYEKLKEQTEHYDPSAQIISTPGATIQIEKFADTVIKVGDFITKNDTDGAQITSQSEQRIEGSQTTTTNVLLQSDDVRIAVADQTSRESEISNSWDLLKSIVFGGLTESITSLGVVSSAAGAGASTLNIFALGLANLIGGFLVIVHQLFELRAVQDHPTERVGRYWEVLGQRANFRLHFVVAVISYIIVGLLPPVIYGFSFWKSDNREYKLLSVSGASLLCIALLAIGKAHVKPQKPYLKTLFYYLSLGASASGISYVAGVMVDRLIEKLGLFDYAAAPSSPTAFLLPQVSSSRVLSSPWASS